jgi:hypothetical protein
MDDVDAFADLCGSGSRTRGRFSSCWRRGQAQTGSFSRSSRHPGGRLRSGLGVAGVRLQRCSGPLLSSISSTSRRCWSTAALRVIVPWPWWTALVRSSLASSATVASVSGSSAFENRSVSSRRASWGASRSVGSCTVSVAAPIGRPPCVRERAQPTSWVSEDRLRRALVLPARGDRPQRTRECASVAALYGGHARGVRAGFLGVLAPSGRAETRS